MFFRLYHKKGLSLFFNFEETNINDMNTKSITPNTVIKRIGHLLQYWFEFTDRAMAELWVPETINDPAVPCEEKPSEKTTAGSARDDAKLYLYLYWYYI